MWNTDKVKIKPIETGYIVKRRSEKAHFGKLEDALYFIYLLLSERQTTYSFEQYLKAIEDQTVHKLEIDLPKRTKAENT